MLLLTVALMYLSSNIQELLDILALLCSSGGSTETSSVTRSPGGQIGLIVLP